MKGWAFKPGSSERFAAQIDVRDDWIFLIDPVEKTVLSKSEPSQTSLDQAAGGGTRNLYFADGWLFQTEDSRVSLLMQESLSHRLLRLFEQFHPRLIALAVLCMIGSMALWKWAIPAMVTIAVWMTPEPMIRQVDRATLETMDFTMLEASNLSQEQKDAQNAILDDLRHALGTEDSFNLVFRDMPGMGANAAALPGGTIIVSDALVSGYGADPDVIAGVLAHEMGHVVEEHGLRQVYRSLSLYLIIAMMAGDVGPVLEDLLLEGQAFASLSYSRKHELSADRFAVRLLNKSEYDTDGFKRFFADLSDGEEPPAWFSTHPTHSDRIEQIDEMNRHHH